MGFPGISTSCRFHLVVSDPRYEVYKFYDVVIFREESPTLLKNTQLNTRPLSRLSINLRRGHSDALSTISRLQFQPYCIKREC